MYSTILKQRSKNLPTFLLQSLTFSRTMGGGPRTFPGGLNKWQWKRLHEKKAREKEKRLLQQEKQIYQARVRSEIRSKLVDPNLSPIPQSDNQPNYGPLSPKDHIKALADRFMKDGAEDLWNEADGPIVSSQLVKPVKHESNCPPINLRKLITDNQSNAESIWLREVSSEANNFSKRRHYSVCSASILSNLSVTRHYSCYSSPGGRNLGKCDEGEKSTSLSSLWNPRFYSVDTHKSAKSSRFKFRKDESSSGDDESGDDGWLMTRGDGNSRGLKIGSIGKDLSDEVGDDDDVGDRSNVMKMRSKAALGNYDRKIKKRVPLQSVENEDDLTQHVQAIRNEFNKRKMAESVGISEEEDSVLSQKRFDECDVSPLTVKALTSAGYTQMTRVQEATMSACLEGKDALVKAKTGRGKSAAFLLPAIETVLKAASISTKTQQIPPVCVLILCPTRELASQIAAEANVMVKFHDDIGVQTLVGGTRFKLDQKRLESAPCQIIVATPGRLLDHIENKSGFSSRLMKLKMLIIDEADHLLDLGFRRDMEKIVDCLPRQRQSLFFSATLPKEVRRLSQLVLHREHVYIDTVGLGCIETPVKVKQSCIVVPHEQHFQIVYHLLKEHIAKVPDYKVIVFCTTAMITSLMFSLLHEMKMNVREIHSRKPQHFRTRVSDEFKEAKRLILITSEVSARGMNYPDVTSVIQVGIPIDREQYIHRLGRTGREGKDGERILLLAPWEEYFLGEIKDLPVEKSASPHIDPDVKLKIKNSMAKIDTSVKEAAYHAWLDYYNSNPDIGRDKTTLAEFANGFCESMGLQTPPAIFRKTAVKMGLRDIPGIRIRK